MAKSLFRSSVSHRSADCSSMILNAKASQHVWTFTTTASLDTHVGKGLVVAQLQAKPLLLFTRFLQLQLHACSQLDQVTYLTSCIGRTGHSRPRCGSFDLKRPRYIREVEQGVISRRLSQPNLTGRRLHRTA